VARQLRQIARLRPISVAGVAPQPPVIDYQGNDFYRSNFHANSLIGNVPFMDKIVIVNVTAHVSFGVWPGD
jgi:hypothetical protein